MGPSPLTLLADSQYVPHLQYELARLQDLIQGCPEDSLKWSTLFTKARDKAATRDSHSGHAAREPSLAGSTAAGTPVVDELAKGVEAASLIPEDDVLDEWEVDQATATDVLATLADEDEEEALTHVHVHFKADPEVSGPPFQRRRRLTNAPFS